MDYLEVRFSVSPKEIGSDVLIAALSEIGFDSFVDSELGFNAYIAEQSFSEGLFQELINTYSNSFQISYTQHKIPQQNWNKVWEESFEPIDIEGKCYIRAPFHPEKNNYPYQIIIEPKMSFGTGHHFTTQLMIKKMMELNLEGKALLDMGCGTGVLAILAVMLGAKPVMAVDIDEWSIENTIENIERNTISNVVVKQGDISVVNENHFFYILANINKNVLLSDISDYSHMLERGGHLILSGFFETDVNELNAKAESCGLSLLGTLIDSGWALLHFNKR
jgi:ribosomal protein L11 methyltransferase